MARGHGPSLGAALQALVAAEAGRLATYTAKGWHAKLVQLSGTERGRQAADRAGLNPTRETYLRWLRDPENTPNKANLRRIEQAYKAVARKPFPASMRTGDLKIYGKVAFDDDVRDRGAGRTAPFLVDAGEGNWDQLAAMWDDGVMDDDLWETAFITDVFDADIDTSADVGFPGTSYTLTH